MALKLLMCDRRMAVEYFPNYTESVVCFSRVGMVAKPKHPINICDESANKADKAETQLFQEVCKMFFLEKSLYSDWGFLITLCVNGLTKNIHSKVLNTHPNT